MAEAALSTAETSHTDDTSPARTDRPVLSVVRDEEPSSVVEAVEQIVQDPEVGRMGVICAIVGFVIVTAAITVAGTLSGLGLGGSFALGAFAGIWGGLGFGFMMGATIPLARHLDAHPDS